MIAAKLSGRADLERISALTKLMSVGDDITDAEIGLSSISQGPNLEPLAESGLFVVKGLVRARANLAIIGEGDQRRESLSRAWLSVCGRLSIETSRGEFDDPNAELIFRAGSTSTARGMSLPEDTYYVFEAKCLLKPTS